MKNKLNNQIKGIKYKNGMLRLNPKDVSNPNNLNNCDERVFILETKYKFEPISNDYLFQRKINNDTFEFIRLIKDGSIHKKININKTFNEKEINNTFEFFGFNNLKDFQNNYGDNWKYNLALALYKSNIDINYVNKIINQDEDLNFNLDNNKKQDLINKFIQKSFDNFKKHKSQNIDIIINEIGGKNKDYGDFLESLKPILKFKVVRAYELTRDYDSLIFDEILSLNTYLLKNNINQKDSKIIEFNTLININDNSYIDINNKFDKKKI